MSLALQAIAEGLAGGLWHHVEQQARRFARVKEGQDVRMTQPRRYFYLPEEPLPADGVRDLAVENL